MHTSHPVFGDLVTANRLVRGGRWVFRGTIVPLDDVFADLDAGMSLHAVWEKHGTLDRSDLEAVAARALRAPAAVTGRPDLPDAGRVAPGEPLGRGWTGRPGSNGRERGRSADAPS